MSNQKGRHEIDTGGRSGLRASKPIVILTVVLTSALWLLGTIIYVRLTFPPPNSGQCASSEGEHATAPMTRSARTESLAMAIASMASANPGERPSPATDAAPNPAEVVPNEVAGEAPMSKEEVLARQRADAYTLEQQLLGEEVDPIWSAKVQRETTEMVTRLGPSVHLDDVTCRETLCRANLSHRDPNARDEDTDRLLSMPVIAGQAFAYAPSNDDRKTVLYFSRKGTYLSVLQGQAPLTPPLWRQTSDLPASEP